GAYLASGHGAAWPHALSASLLSGRAGGLAHQCGPGYDAFLGKHGGWRNAQLPGYRQVQTLPGGGHRGGAAEEDAGVLDDADDPGNGHRACHLNSGPDRYRYWSFLLLANGGRSECYAP